MSRHPYETFPDCNFWGRSIAGRPVIEVDPVVSAKFVLSTAERIVTAGSCFAQHIARHLQARGFNYFITEPANPAIPAHIAETYSYGLFTARYGNIYTSRQLVQLLRRAYGLFHPREDVWTQRDGRLIDPFRPRIQPRGFASMVEYRADRRQHFAAVRRAVEELDVFVFTLGLTEGWVAREDGAAYPLCPGVAGGAFDDAKYTFLNLGVQDVIADLREAVRLIRTRNPAARFIFTVSPVPLIATAERRSVLVSTVYSKSVLRVAAEELANGDDRIAYFPSYEIITGQHARGLYFADDLRSVTEEGVRHVMELFFHHYGDQPAYVPSEHLHLGNPTAQADGYRQLAEAFAVMCDEIALDVRSPKA